MLTLQNLANAKGKKIIRADSIDMNAICKAQICK